MVSYKTSRPVYTSYFTTVWNKEPKRTENVFGVKTTIEKNGEVVKEMKAGETYYINVSVKVDSRSSYLMLEVPIPAGCIQATNENKNGSETHRENFKNKTNIYFIGLNPGNYTFKVAVKAAYPGTYTMNPAKMSMMYFPAIYGSEENKKVVILK